MVILCSDRIGAFNNGFIITKCHTNINITDLACYPKNGDPIQIESDFPKVIEN